MYNVIYENNVFAHKLENNQMDSLFQKLLKVDNWKCYNAMIIKDYQEALQNPIQFIMTYFDYGGKTDYLLNSVYNSSQEGRKRAAHVVNTYFLGLYLQSRLPFLQPENILLNRDRHFLWAWFLCALYHDAFFNDHDHLCTDRINYGYCGKNDRFLYSKATIEKYFQKNACTSTSYDGKEHVDHGIVAASQLYQNYIQMICLAIRYQGKEEKDFYTETGILLGGLKINYKTLDSLCKIAKVIACHNIFVCSQGEEDKYKSCRLSHLIPSNGKFRKMPHSRNQFENDYEKLYYLLCLTDGLEPSKRGISLHNIDFDIYTTGCRSAIDISGTVSDKYLNTVKDLEKWLTGIKVTEEGRHIEIDIQPGCSRPVSSYSIPWEIRKRVIWENNGEENLPSLVDVLEDGI